MGFSRITISGRALAALSNPRGQVYCRSYRKACRHPPPVSRAIWVPQPPLEERTTVDSTAQSAVADSGEPIPFSAVLVSAVLAGNYVPGLSGIIGTAPQRIRKFAVASSGPGERVGSDSSPRGTHSTEPSRARVSNSIGVLHESLSAANPNTLPYVSCETPESPCR